MKIPPGTETFDVRPLLAAGSDPFDAIQARWSAIASGAYLVIRTPFQPRPLIAHFGTRGIPTSPYSASENDHWLLLGPKP